MSFFFNDTATTEIYTLSLHDALPIYVVADDEVLYAGDEPGHRECRWDTRGLKPGKHLIRLLVADRNGRLIRERSEEHTSELQSRQYLVCRLLLEKKKYNSTYSFAL